MNGLLVPPGDVEALSAALDAVANDQDLYERLALNASMSACSQFSWTAIAREFSDVYAKEPDRTSTSFNVHSEESRETSQEIPVISPLFSLNKIATLRPVKEDGMQAREYTP